MVPQLYRFQSTHPRGVRRGLRTQSAGNRAISIHAPTWGATSIFHSYRAPVYISIHAPTWGATYSSFILCSAYRFQSTHPRGVRLDCAHNRPEIEQFQSTHPRGVRRQKVKELPISQKFQSTHPRGGATGNYSGDVAHQRISIHAPTWGCDPCADSL